MESTVDEPIDPSVGGLVWVRRRNGAWWPGRILSVDEISESCLISPRSGTPIKLLGRDDASVDWYNLEKSRRVKAFRCGEYDKCIEKAKYSAANPNKKAVKYARREDAILHALELERALQVQSPPRLYPELDKLSGQLSHSAKESPSLFHSGKEDNTENYFKEDSGSAHELSQSGISFEDSGRVSASKIQPGRQKPIITLNNSEDDETEGIEDLSLHVKSKREVSTGETADLTDPCNGKGNEFSFKRKRSQVSNANKPLKSKNRCRPLTKVLESTVLVSVQIDELPSSNGSSICGLSGSKVNEMESTELVSSFSLPTSSHAYGSSLVIKNIKENDIPSIMGFPENGSSGKLFDVPLGLETLCADISPLLVPCSSVRSAEGASVLVDEMAQRTEKGTSEWQLKGRRNSRHLSRNRKQSSINDINVDDDVASTDQLDDDYQRVDFDGSVNNSTLQMKSEQFTDNLGSSLINWSRCPQQHRILLEISSLPYGKSPLSSACADPELYEVEVEVKLDYCVPHVPLVSLMSKYNGKPITGHPLAVDVLDDGCCDMRISAMNGRKGMKMQRHFSQSKLSKKKKMKKKRKKKMKKKGVVGMGKKIKKLSSLSSHRSKEEMKAVLEKRKVATAMACIPVKLVFGRINEAVGSLSCWGNS